MATIPPCHLPRLPAVRDNGNGRAYRLNDVGMPTHDGSPESVLACIGYLAVSKSPRYQPGNGQTYCNIYACDLTHLLGAYIPRVWWDASLIKAAEVSGVWPSVGTWNVNAHELSANALFDWLITWSHRFGWRRVSLDEGQAAANAGHATVICGVNRNGASSGHISCIAPESDAVRAVRDAEGHVTHPVQSQAGGVNRELYTTASPGRWYLSVTFRAWGVWTVAPEGIPDTEPETPTGKSTPRLAAVREPIADLSVDAPATPLRAPEGEHTVPLSEPDL